MEYGHNGPGALYDPTHKELGISSNCTHPTHLKINLEILLCLLHKKNKLKLFVYRYFM